MHYITLYEKFYNPPLEIKVRLDNIVKGLIDKHHGGRKFFDELDAAIKDIVNEDMLIALLKGSTNEYICTSGEFGNKIYTLWKNKKIKCKGIVVFNGKMSTLDLGVQKWYPEDFDLQNKEFIYIDDSYFSGGTANKINSFLQEKNSKLKSISVIYDGCKEKKKYVRSFFRYYK